MTIIFSVWRFVFSIGWAKSGTWMTTERNQRRIYILSIHVLEKDNNRALNFILGPISLIVGYAV